MKLPQFRIIQPLSYLTSSAFVLLALGGASCAYVKDTPVKKAVAASKALPAIAVDHFKQGWSKEEAMDFYFTSQGSQLIPYAWFLALELHNNSDYFKGDQNIKNLGYIAQPKTAGINPDGLPIGFVKDTTPEGFLSTGLSGDGIPNSARNKEWLGLTCAACHTSEIVVDQQTLRINGGPPLSDMQSLLQNMSKSLAATSQSDAKMTRFAKRVLAQGGHNAIEQQALKTQLVDYTRWLDSYIEVNYGGLTTPYGYGRLDAFGAILNRVSSSLLHNPSNSSPANAPVSYPFLWNASQLDWVQWNGSANNHIGRNVGEVTGVFAHTILDTTDDKERFYSSGNMRSLGYLEDLMSKLDSPKWSVPLPEIDQTKAGKGKVLFAANCVSCHGVRDELGEFPMTEANKYGTKSIKIEMIAVSKIGTDPLMAMNFIDPKLNADPGAMRKYIAGYMMGKVKDAGATEAGISGIGQQYLTAPKVARGLILTVASGLIVQKLMAESNPPLTDRQKLDLMGSRENKKPPNLEAYKARPLNGIWATAPYMHNGSMANLYQTLLPDGEREKSFYVGSNVFDSKLVGFKTSKTGNKFLYRTDEVGNSNAGHSGNNLTKTLEKGKWRNFTDIERFDLIEYMKTL